MIPTTVSSSPCSASAASVGAGLISPSNSGGLLMNHNNGFGSNALNAGQQNSPQASVLGIASLILEGRAITDDDYQQPSQNHYQQLKASPPRLTPPLPPTPTSSDGRHSPKPSTSKMGLTSFLAGSGGGAAGAGGCTNIALTSINITTNPYAFASNSRSNCGATSTPLYIDTPPALPAYRHPNPSHQHHSSTSTSSASSAESTHQRWTQKLCQLRQASPAASLSMAPFEQKVAVEAPSSSGSGLTAEPELVALVMSDAANNKNSEHGANEPVGDYEIVSRVVLSRASAAAAGPMASSSISLSNAGSASSSPGSENFLHSLQTLATTCLRGSPSSLESPTGYHYTPKQHPNTPLTTANLGSMAAYRTMPPRLQNSYNLDTTTSFSGGSVQAPKSKSKFKDCLSTATATSSSSSCSSSSSSSTSSLSTGHSAMPSSTSPFFAREPSANECRAAVSATISTPPATATSSADGANTASTTAAATTKKSPKLQQGPHCDQFLRKMGLIKGEATNEPDEHYCDMSYVNITCSRWRLHCSKIEAILGRGEPVCIEVYLGPVGHKILLEQWIITKKEKVSPPTMTLPSLCSAIRSQLYFSQISAWCDLIHKSDKSIYDTGRVIFSSSSSTSIHACDLAMTLISSAAAAAAGTANAANATLTCPLGTSVTLTPAATPNAATANATPASSPTLTSNSPLGSFSSTMLNNRKPRLNIFYRIKSYDSTACFNSKPIIHNFPNVNISENSSISVCLKSLPRINGGIPKISASAAAANSTTATVTTATFTLSSSSGSSASSAPLPLASKGLAGKLAKNNLAMPHAATLNYANGSSTSSGSAGGGKNSSSSNGRSAGTFAGGMRTTGEETPRSSRQSTAPKMSYTNANAAAAARANSICDSKKARSSASSSSVRGDEAPGCAIASGSGSGLAYQQPATRDASHSVGTSRHHKCTFFIDESELEGEDDQNHCDLSLALNDMSDAANTSSSHGSFNAATGHLMSHREKQLLKYRKRMLKRDKKQRKTVGGNGCVGGGSESCIPMEQGDGEGDGDGCSDDEQDPTEYSSAFSDSQSLKRQASSALGIEMISTGTQTPSSGCCQQCGTEKILICMKCTNMSDDKSLVGFSNRKSSGGSSRVNSNSNIRSFDGNNKSPSIFNNKSFEENMDDMDSSSLSSCDIISTPRTKADLLLQAIQRTPKAAKKHKKQASSAKASNGAGCSGGQVRQAADETNGGSFGAETDGQLEERMLASSGYKGSRNNNQHMADNVASRDNPGQMFASNQLAQLQGCQVCKRQKTQHNFGNGSEATNGTSTGGLKENADADMATISGMEAATAKAINGSSFDEQDLAEGEDDDDGDGKAQAKPSSKSASSLRCSPRNPANDVKSFADSDGTWQDSDVIAEESFFSTTRITTFAGDYEPALLVGVCSSNALKQQRSGTPPLRTSDAGENSSSLSNNEFKTPSPASSSTITTSLSSRRLKADERAGPCSKFQPSKPNVLKVSCGYMNDELTNDGSLFGQQQQQHRQQQQQQQQAQEAPLHSLFTRKGLPKVNLTPIFCSPSGCSSSAKGIAFNGNASSVNYSMEIPSPLAVSCTSSPEISAFDFDRLGSGLNRSLSANTAGGAGSHHNDQIDGSMPYVQKSYSAPTLPNSPSLSPRFAKQAAIYKRRSRHLSDRSDRSSLGSDEQFSDEELECAAGMGVHSGGLYGTSPATSPMKQRSRLLHTFGRQSLLGNLEESLFQRRIVPKTEVMGFKVQLGASGNFCPTQLTIPATAFFYEMHGETFCTPYLCEVRLPRKGYSVPRTGTIQATLLNPMGTVVRMFVIPYDMRDMPALHQTFMRQRILAANDSDGGNGNKSAHNNNNDRSSSMEAVESSSEVVMMQTNQSEESERAAGDHEFNNRSATQSNTVSDMKSHFISAENMKRLRYSIHLRFQTSRSGRLMLHTDIRILISRRTDCDTAAAHAKGVLETQNDLVTCTVMPLNPKYSARQEGSGGGSSSSGSGSGSGSNYLAGVGGASSISALIASRAAGNNNNNSKMNNFNSHNNNNNNSLNQNNNNYNNHNCNHNNNNQDAFKSNIGKKHNGSNSSSSSGSSIIMHEHSSNSLSLSVSINNNSTTNNNKI